MRKGLKIVRNPTGLRLTGHARCERKITAHGDGSSPSPEEMISIGLDEA
jgi:hypothetical protein